MGFHRSTEQSINLQTWVEYFKGSAKILKSDWFKLQEKQNYSGKSLFDNLSAWQNRKRFIWTYMTFTFRNFRNLYFGYNYNIINKTIHSDLLNDSEYFIFKTIFCTNKIAFIFTAEMEYKSCLRKLKSFATVKLYSHPNSLIV